MTDEQINAAIARHLKWTGVVSCPQLGVMGLPPARNECDIPYIRTAMWTEDLNAMHEAEKQMAEIDWVFFMTELAGLVRLPKQAEVQIKQLVHATARQRAEAFLRALGKWEEVQG